MKIAAAIIFVFIICFFIEKVTAQDSLDKVITKDFSYQIVDKKGRLIDKEYNFPQGIYFKRNSIDTANMVSRNIEIGYPFYQYPAQTIQLIQSWLHKDNILVTLEGSCNYDERNAIKLSLARANYIKAIILKDTSISSDQIISKGMGTSHRYSCSKDVLKKCKKEIREKGGDRNRFVYVRVSKKK